MGNVANPKTFDAAIDKEERALAKYRVLAEQKDAAQQRRDQITE